MSVFAQAVVHGTARPADPAAPPAGATFTWVHVEGIGEDAAALLAGPLALDPIVVGALTAQETRPRCDAIGDGALVNLRGLAADPARTGDELASVRLYAERARVVSVSRHRLAAADAVEPAMAGGRLHDPGDLVAAFARAITAGLDPDVAALGDSLDDAELAVDTKDAFGLRHGIAQARRRAIGLRRFVGPQREALDRLAGLECDWLEEADRLHIREAADRFARMSEELESVRERAALLHDQLTDLRAEQLDTRGLILSVVALVFLPLTFLTGLLGMNVGGVPLAADPTGFWWIVAICAVLAILPTAWFAHAHWFRK